MFILNNNFAGFEDFGVGRWRKRIRKITKPTAKVLKYVNPVTHVAKVVEKTGIGGKKLADYLRLAGGTSAFAIKDPKVARRAKQVYGTAAVVGAAVLLAPTVLPGAAGSVAGAGSAATGVAGAAGAGATAAGGLTALGAGAGATSAGGLTALGAAKGATGAAGLWKTITGAVKGVTGAVKEAKGIFSKEKGVETIGTEDSQPRFIQARMFGNISPLSIVLFMSASTVAYLIFAPKMQR